MTESRDPGRRDDTDAAPASFPPIAERRSSLWYWDMQGDAAGCLFASVVLGLATVFAGLSAYERPERKWLILACWGGGLVLVLAVTAVFRRRRVRGFVKGVLFGIGIGSLLAGMCYFGS